MTRMLGPLSKAIARRSQTAKMAAIVVHVNDTFGGNPCEEAQKKILQACFNNSVPVYFFGMRLMLAGPSEKLWSAYPAENKKFYYINTGNNVFNGIIFTYGNTTPPTLTPKSPLDTILKNANVTTLVVMGQDYTSCIRMSLSAIPLDNQGQGALDLGYTVMTCRALLRGDDKQVATGVNTTVHSGDMFDNLITNTPKLEWYEGV
jgi:nicotinamidase-related amidase